MPEESRNKVIPYHEQRHMNFIALIFALILIYLIVQIIRMFTGEEYSVYELQKEEMYSAASIRRGIILREEVPVTSVLSGSLNYLTSEEAGRLWGITPRRVNILCKNFRVST